jgi:hypothetical protein
LHDARNGAVAPDVEPALHAGEHERAHGGPRYGVVVTRHVLEEEHGGVGADDRGNGDVRSHAEVEAHTRARDLPAVRERRRLDVRARNEPERAVAGAELEPRVESRGGGDVVLSCDGGGSPARRSGALRAELLVLAAERERPVWIDAIADARVDADPLVSHLRHADARTEQPEALRVAGADRRLEGLRRSGNSLLHIGPLACLRLLRAGDRRYEQSERGRSNPDEMRFHGVLLLLSA